MKRCKLCGEEKELEEFKKNLFYIEQDICPKCLGKARARIAALADFDVQICRELNLDYRQMTGLRRTP